MVIKQYKFEVEPGNIMQMYDYYIGFMKRKYNSITAMNEKSSSYYYIASKFDYDKWKLIMSINKKDE